MDTLVTIQKEALDQHAHLKQQLISISEQMFESDEEYTFYPLSEYMDVFCQTLEKNEVSYQLNNPSAP